MLNVRTTHSTVGLLALMMGMGCSPASGDGDGDAPESPTLVAAGAHSRCSPGGSGRRSISKDPKGCRQIMFVCAPGETPFFDACGCGCERR
ncbi:hypothetical protein [Myxococcus sp. CA056]|uniref:hypothetical protein n=1 Tax=Myxococcus sp. CA056 TaxID=2741740 RepID=UPI003530455F